MLNFSYNYRVTIFFFVFVHLENCLLFHACEQKEKEKEEKKIQNNRFFFTKQNNR